MKLILVDDNVHFREDLKFFIENRLIHDVISEANNGEDFLRLENIDEADIILMDLLMEKLNGFEAAKKILRRFPHLKIIAMSMNTEQTIQARLCEAGFKGFINKSEIFACLEAALQSVYSNKTDFFLMSKKPIC
jgi:DNA-binding NarL/FixJ family response regulator